MYIVYLALSILSRKIKCDVAIPTLITISLILFVLLSIYKDCTAWAWNFFSWIHVCHYLQFFTLGLICAKYKEKFFRLLDNNTFITTMIIGWVITQYLNANQHLLDPIPFGRVVVCRELMRYFALMTVISMFYGVKEYFDKDNAYAVVLKKIGRRTLDIYFIHYFFIPNLLFMMPWFAGNRMIIVQLVFTLLVTLAVVALCMLVSAVLRNSQTLANWLFGEKAVLKSQIIK